MNAVTITVFQSRFGYHPCDKETYLKLKRLKKVFYEELKRFADWNRWNRKQPQNRVIRKWIRNETRQKIGCEIVGPRPEPSLPKVFIARKKVYNTTGAGFENGMYNYRWTLDDYGLSEEIYNCRPKSSPQDVKPMRMTIEQIDELLAKAY